MEQTLDQLKEELPLLADHAMEAFCDDLNSMLGTSLACSEGTVAEGPLSDLKRPFLKLSTVYAVDSTGGMDGLFYLAFDRKGTFILPGIVVMLPEKLIQDQSKRGTKEDADNLADSIREVGNLLVGSWDRIFREECVDHEHFLQKETFIGDLWGKTEIGFGQEASTECLSVTWELTPEGFAPVTCTVIFPAALFEPPPPPAADAVASDEDDSESADLSEQAAQSTDATDAEPEQEPPVVDSPAEDGEKVPAADPEPVTSQDTQPPASPPVMSDTGETEDMDPQPASEPGPVRQAIETLVSSEEAPNSDNYNIAFPSIPINTVMNRSVSWCRMEESIENALQLMDKRNSDYILVEDGENLAGILSRSDLAAALSPYLRPAFSAYRRPLDDASLQIRVKWFMSRPVHTLPEETPLYRALEKMARRRIRALPVVNESGAVTGIITVFDIFSYLLKADIRSAKNPKALQTSTEPEDGKKENDA